MKKTLLVFALILTAATKIFSQGFNMGLNLGYGFGAGNQNITERNTETTTENVKGSFGQGLNLGLNFNYMFTPNFGMDLGVGMLMGKEFEITSNYSDGTEVEKFKGNMFRVMPGFKVSANSDNTIAPYSRFGLVAGVGTKLTYTYSSTDFTFGESEFYEYEFSEGVSLGWYGAFGLGIRLSEKVRLNTELLMINQTWSPKKLTNTANSDGPLDPPVTLEDEIIDSQIYNDLSPRLPFGSIGINAGIQIGF